MFNLKNVETQVEQVIRDQLVDVFLDRIAELIYKEMYVYLEDTDKRITYSEKRFKLDPSKKQQIGLRLKKLAQQGVDKVITSNLTQGGDNLYGLSVHESQTGISYKIKLNDMFQNLIAERTGEWLGEIYTQRDTEEQDKLSQLFDLFLQATNKEVFYERVQNYLDSDKFIKEFQSLLEDEIGE